MNYQLRILSFFIFMICFRPCSIQAQQLTGIWRGHFRSNDDIERLSSGYDDRYKIEVQIAQTKNHFQAVTFSYKNTEFYGKALAAGTINPETRKVLLKESKIVEVRMAKGDVYVMTCFLHYSKLGDEEYLQGTYYSTNSRDSLIGGDKGSIFLRRVISSDFQKEPFLEKREKELLASKKLVTPAPKPNEKLAAAPPPVKKPAPVSSPVHQNTPAAPKTALSSPPKTKQKDITQKKSVVATPEANKILQDSPRNIIQPEIPIPVPAVLASRKNELLKTLTVNNNQIEIRIYDDGAIDNDSVSVYYDNKLIISKARLTDQPIIAKITVSPSAHPHQLVMVAENLGDIPPNTSLLVVSDGDKRYEERIISNEQKNVMINFMYKKIE
jgi:hypothetical protein